jgi:hypothetical protein
MLPDQILQAAVPWPVSSEVLATPVAVPATCAFNAGPDPAVGPDWPASVP